MLPCRRLISTLLPIHSTEKGSSKEAQTRGEKKCWWRKGVQSFLIIIERMERMKKESIVKWKMDLFLMIKFLFQGWPLITVEFGKDSLEAKRAIYLTIKSYFRKAGCGGRKLTKSLVLYELCCSFDDLLSWPRFWMHPDDVLWQKISFSVDFLEPKIYSWLTKDAQL